MVKLIKLKIVKVKYSGDPVGDDIRREGILQGTLASVKIEVDNLRTYRWETLTLSQCALYIRFLRRH